jgi:hypothetical protein
LSVCPARGTGVLVNANALTPRDVSGRTLIQSLLTLLTLLNRLIG